jgi:uncharacterized protein involved in exopolysaccharide biosynthesis
MTVPTTSRFWRYLTVILRWLFVAVSVFLLVRLAGLSIADHLLPKVYTAKAEMLLQPKSGIPLLKPTSPTPTPFQPEFEAIESSDFLLPLIHDLGLDKAWDARIFQSKDDQLIDSESLDYMHKILKLEVKPGTDRVEITASSDLPQEAADIANAVADRYKTLRDIEEFERSNQGNDALKAQITQLEKVVDDKKAALEKMPQDQSSAYLAAQHDLDQQQSLLDAMNIRLRQDNTDFALQESPVRIICHAQPPEYPTKPNRTVCLVVTTVIAGLLSIMAASFVELISLFLRAADGQDV